MGVQFGTWNLDDQPNTVEFVDKVKATLAPYGPDSDDLYSKDGLTVFFNAFHTTKESHLESQPHISASGAVITWDGRLDNRKELIRELRDFLTADLTDVGIVAAAYERWGKDCFGKLIGDWALSIWKSNDRSLILAKDPIGTRHLYYRIGADQITWSSILDPIVRFAEGTFDLDKEYVAGWFSSYPAVHLTPCVGIHAVPPSCCVFLKRGRHDINEYWDFNPGKKIRYGTDAEYEEHFRCAFAKAVERRLRSDQPVLAELSGGRDSSSIVCMADAIMARGEPQCGRLDTVSYYDESEPNWDERPYFTKVEEKRGRTGWHIDMGSGRPKEPARRQLVAQPTDRRFVSTPGCDGRTPSELGQCIAAQGNRVLLSGIGGDEVMGGVPTPTPELEDLLATGRFGALAHQLKLWALQVKTPWFHLFWQAAIDFLPLALVGVPRHLQPPVWLQPNYVKRYRAAVTGYPSRTRLFGPRPSFQSNMGTLDALRRQLACAARPFGPPFEKRYPYLDRDLLEFMCAIPRDQLVRPSQRRSLMRRALVGIVPDEILNRRGKAFVARKPMVAIQKDWSSLVANAAHMIAASLGIVDSDRYLETLQEARHGKEAPLLLLVRTMHIEGWLKDLLAGGHIRIGTCSRHEMTLQESTPV